MSVEKGAGRGADMKVTSHETSDDFSSLISQLHGKRTVRFLTAHSPHIIISY